MPPANTLVRWVNENAFASIVQARPCPTFGRPVHPWGSPHRLRPGTSPHALRIPPRDGHPALRSIARKWLQVRLGCVRLLPSCPFRLLHTCFLSSASEALPPLLDMAPLIREPEGLQPSRTTRCSAHTMASADFCMSLPAPFEAGSTELTFGTHADLPGYDTPTFTLIPVGYTSQRSVQVSGFNDIGRLAPLQRLISASCSSGQRFAYSFLQIRSHPRHPCRLANSSPCRASRGLTPPSECALPGAPK